MRSWSRLCGVNSFIVTIGMLLALKGAAAIPTDATTIYGLPDRSTAGSASTRRRPQLDGGHCLCRSAFALSFWLRNSVAGRHLYAIGGDKVAAQSRTASPRQDVMLVYGASGGLAAIAGWLNAARLNSGVGIGGRRHHLHGLRRDDHRRDFAFGRARQSPRRPRRGDPAHLDRQRPQSDCAESALRQLRPRRRSSSSRWSCSSSAAAPGGRFKLEEPAA